MPRIPPLLIDSVIYLYPSVDFAERGEAAGGSGFIVGVRSSDERRNQVASSTTRLLWDIEKGKSGETLYALYAVTNSHVIRLAESPVVRLNSKTGGTVTLDLPLEAWLHHPDGDDVAVCPIGLSTLEHEFSFVPSEFLIARKSLRQKSIGPGDDVFFLGRFVTHEGRLRNSPTVRFGNVAMMPGERIRSPATGLEHESFLVEARSLPGYSGSPVFVYTSSLELEIDPDDVDFSEATYHPMHEIHLLGIDWCHLATYAPVLESNRIDPISENWWVSQNSGMMGVVPAWKLAELLASDDPRDGTDKPKTLSSISNPG